MHLFEVPNMFKYFVVPREFARKSREFRPEFHSSHHNRRPSRYSFVPRETKTRSKEISTHPCWFVVA